LLNTMEAAQVLRRSVHTLRFWQRDPNRQPKFEIAAGVKMYRAQVLRDFIAGTTT
jgi:hypothetical protein